jgi:uncharacterized membrane protein
MFPFALALALHTLAAAVWVGGLFFAALVLRPAMGGLPPAERLGLWIRVLQRFFRWVWLSVGVLLATGYGVLLLGYRGGLGGGGLHIDIMQVTGLIMTGLFAYVYFGPWQGLKTAAAAGDLEGAARRQERIRAVVAVNLALGLFTTAVGATGTLWAY